MEESSRKRKTAGSAKEFKPARKTFPSKKSSDDWSGKSKSDDFSSPARKRSYIKKSDSEDSSDRPFRRKSSETRAEDNTEGTYKPRRSASSEFKPGRNKFGKRGDSESRSYEKRPGSDRSTGESGFNSGRKKFGERGDSESRPFGKRDDRDRKFGDSGFRSDRKKFGERGDSSSRPYGKRTDRDRNSESSDFKPGRKPFGERREDASGSFEGRRRKDDNTSEFRETFHSEGKPFRKKEFSGEKKRFAKSDTARPSGSYKEFKERKSASGKYRHEESSTSFRKHPGETGSFGKKPFKSGEQFREEQELRPDQQFRKSSERAPAIPGNIRLNKYLAHAGVASRRKADELILAGKVKVNGAVITEMGYRLAPGDKVEFNQQYISPESKVYVLLNKPKDYITTTSDEKDRRTIMDLIAGVYRSFEKHRRPRLYPVGRLDRNTSGVLLITNDGELAQALTHPSKGVQKVYHVVLNKNFRKEDFDRVADGGLVLEDGIAQVDEIAYPNPDNRKEVGIQIHTGKNRFVRRIFEALEYEVVKLDRVYFAGLSKKDLPRGKWRFLTDEEVRMLKYFQR